MHWNSHDVSYFDYVEPSSTNTRVSTLVDISSTCHMYPNLDNEYVNLISHEDASGSSSPSFGASSSSPPIFHYNEDIMEVIMTPNYPWDDMHHHVYFLPLQIHYLYVLEFKDFIHGEVNWFKIPIPTPVEE